MVKSAFPLEPDARLDLVQDSMKYDRTSDI
jgi:hypothetical protein